MALTLEDVFMRAAELADEELMLIKEEKLEEWVNDAASKFYAAYDPLFYRRAKKGSGKSLYDVLYTERRGDDLFAELRASQMAQYGRSGNPDGLYQLVYQGGWHGGAPSGKGHPHPGTPYYRTPRFIWSTWGTRAKRSEPPEDYVLKCVDEFRETELNPLADRLLTKHLNALIQ